MSSWLGTSIHLVTGTSNQFGTAFAIYGDAHYTYLLTCAHVVEAVGGSGQIQVKGLPATVVGQGDARGPDDLAVLRIVRQPQCVPLPLGGTGRKGAPVRIEGFRKLGVNFQGLPLDGTLGEAAIEASAQNPTQFVTAWQVGILGQDQLEGGYSGSPVVLEESGRVLAVATNAQLQLRRGWAVSIMTLLDIWPTMPPELLAQILRPEVTPRTTQSLTLSQMLQNERRSAGSQPAGLSDSQRQPKPPVPGQDALAAWREKLEFLRREEAITSNAAVKFELRKQIEEAESKIRELRGEPIAGSTRFKLDKSLLVEFDLAELTAEFVRRCVYEGPVSFAVTSQDSTVLREYVVERILLELRRKTGRPNHRQTISLGPRSLADGAQGLIARMSGRPDGRILDLLSNEVAADLVFVVWSPSVPESQMREYAAACWREIEDPVRNALQNKGRSLVLIWISLQDEPLAGFHLLQVPDTFDTGELCPWLRGRLRAGGVPDDRIDVYLDRLAEHEGHPLGTWQALNDIVTDLQGGMG
jgi:hypothetical protein